MVNDAALVSAPNEFWHKKIHFYFHEVLDLNNDQLVNREDLAIFKSIYSHMKHLAPNSPVLHKFSNFLETWFQALLPADKQHGNNDGSITYTEFTAYCEQLRKDLNGQKTLPDSLKYMRDYIESLFEILDYDNDGLICRNDFIQSYADFEDPEDRAKSWKLLCGYNNEDEYKIDLKQFTEFCIEFMTSTNPQDRGNWLFGIY